MLKSATDWVVLARMLRTQGRRGELLAELWTDFPETLKDRGELYLAPADFRGDPRISDPASVRLAQVLNLWMPGGKNLGRVVLEFAGVSNISDAEKLVGLELLTPATNRPRLEEDEVYVSDLVGSTLSAGGSIVGTIIDVHFPTSPDGRQRLSEAAPLLVVTSNSGEELLIPFVKKFLLTVDLENKQITMELPPGLTELNQSLATSENSSGSDESEPVA